MKRLLLASIVLFALASQAQAGPPSYLLLRRPEAPKHLHLVPQPASQAYTVQTHGYAYGYFGVAPRQHHSRHFGVYRTYTQWSRW